MPEIKYGEIVEGIYNRVEAFAARRPKGSCNTDIKNILARFMEDLEADIIDHHDMLSDDPDEGEGTIV